MSLNYNNNNGNTLATTLRRRRREQEHNKHVNEVNQDKQSENKEQYRTIVNRRGSNNNNRYSDNVNNESIQAIEELQSLLRTRSMLNAELHKVDHVVHNLQQSNEQWGVLESTLHEVEASVQAARNFVHKLIRVQSVDDLILKLSILAFICVIVYILAQRVFGFFPVVKYVELDRETVYKV